jgi:hypothetical protein
VWVVVGIRTEEMETRKEKGNVHRPSFHHMCATISRTTNAKDGRSSLIVKRKKR